MSNIKIDKIMGSRRFSNYWWATLVLCGGLGFFLTGLSSYLKTKLFSFIQYSEISFIPQGIVMTFYGTIAILVSVFLWFTILWNIGSGYNEFNNDKGIITIFRQGFPGKNHMLKLHYKVNEIEAIKVTVQEGLIQKKEIYLKTKDNREIPLTHVGEPLLISEMEEHAISIAKFLGVAIENETIN